MKRSVIVQFVGTHAVSYWPATEQEITLMYDKDHSNQKPVEMLPSNVLTVSSSFY